MIYTVKLLSCICHVSMFLIVINLSKTVFIIPALLPASSLTSSLCDDSINTVDAGYKNIVGNRIQCSYNRHVGYNGYRL